MEDDGDAPARPAPLRVARHRDDVAQNHRSEIERAEDEQSDTCAPPRFREEARAAREVEADFAVEDDDDNLARQKPRVREQA